MLLTEQRTAYEAPKEVRHAGHMPRLPHASAVRSSPWTKGTGQVTCRIPLQGAMSSKSALMVRSMKRSTNQPIAK